MYLMPYAAASTPRPESACSQWPWSAAIVAMYWTSHVFSALAPTMMGCAPELLPPAPFAQS